MSSQRGYGYSVLRGITLSFYLHNKRYGVLSQIDARDIEDLLQSSIILRE